MAYNAYMCRLTTAVVTHSLLTPVVHRSVFCQRCKRLVYVCQQSCMRVSTAAAVRHKCSDARASDAQCIYIRQYVRTAAFHELI
eukprot:13206-Heterococcus_DN1.PRE.16